MALDSVLGHDPGIYYVSERDALHGDIIIAIGVKAHSRACNVSSTSKAHRMCVAMVQVQRDTADKSAGLAWKSLETTTSASASSAEKPVVELTPPSTASPSCRCC